MFNKKVDGFLDPELFIYVDDRQPIRPTKTLFWEASRR